MPPSPLRREVASRLVVRVDDPTAFVLAVAVAEGVPTTVETLRVRLDEQPIVLRETTDAHGSRLHLFETGPGILSVDYAATIIGRATPLPVDERDLVTYLRPSRYVQSDALTARARDLFPALEGRGLLAAVEEWVFENLRYDGSATSPTGGAVETLEAGAGVCRDFANVTAAFLRALDVPARLVSVYAPTSMPSSRPASKGAGSWSMRRGWRPGRDSCASRRAATPPTPRSSPTPSPTSNCWPSR
jgi:transglutaminase-like putative cysteine protease